MKKLFFFVSCLTMMALTACSEEQELASQQPAGGFLVIEVADGSGGETRASYSGLSTTFEDGDALGLYAVDASGNVMSDNVRFAKSGGSWSTATPVPFNPDWSYYAYYPYVENPYTPDFTTSGVDNQFATFIADASNKFHQTNQSTKANYSASDLMIAQGSLSGTNTAKFMLDHKKGLAVLTANANGFPVFSGNIPYMRDGKGYYLMKPDTETTIGKYTVSAKSSRYVSVAYDTEQRELYLTLTAEESGTFSFTLLSGLNTSYMTSVSYSLDNGSTWITTANSSSDVVVTTPTIAAGGKVLWKGSGTATSNGGEFAMFEDKYSYFSSTGRFSAKGNVMSMLHGDNFKDISTIPEGNNLGYLFYSCAKLTSVPSDFLPYTGLTNQCYLNMFSGCTSLTTAPELPATTLTSECYKFMFRFCSSLTAAPELPATTLASSCYSSMFSGCTSLTTAPELPATTLASRCYNGMFRFCSSLTAAPELPATTLVYDCYGYMFESCTSLTAAPELPATTLASNCYNNMFYGCSNLSYIKAAFTTTPSYSYTSSWVSGVKSTGTFVKNSAASWDVTGTYGVPSGWTVETYTP